MRNDFYVFSVSSVLIISLTGYFLWHPAYWFFVVIIPLILLGFYDMIQGKHAIMRNFPILGRGRYIMEELRPKLYQYFIESDTNGAPISRIYRSVVYQRAKRELDTSPFGTQLDVYQEGYEWMNHSIGALDAHRLEQDPRVVIGGKDCRQPYSASILNISAMSFGSLSPNAIRALNGGAHIGRFAHNTGEGGISAYHLEHKGDLIYQVGTGYFGCRTKDGRFSPEKFAEQTARPEVRMIEIKLSQGAKPGHGGILPAKKNTPEIAQIRGVEPGTEVDSPPFHSAFSTPFEMVDFIGRLREGSGGKPIGFKLCVGQKHEFLAICKAMVRSGIYPDFITVDGGEGGTGAAPFEFSNTVGAPFLEGLAFVRDALDGFNLKSDIRIIASGKVLTGFHILRALALGADTVNSARGMMLALGCIQAMECNKNTCPTGVATQNPELVAGLVVKDKKVRVANYHRETVESFVELLAAAGLESPAMVNRRHINRRISMQATRRYDELFPYLPQGCLLQEKDVPADWLADWLEAAPERFR